MWNLIQSTIFTLFISFIIVQFKIDTIIVIKIKVGIKKISSLTTVTEYYSFDTALVIKYFC